jgi:hypothetical protein
VEGDRGDGGGGENPAAGESCRHLAGKGHRPGNASGGALYRGNERERVRTRDWFPLWRTRSRGLGDIKSF